MAPLVAVLMVVLLGMVAFAVDVGWMGIAQAELQNAADAAALAGAGQLMDPCVQFSLPGRDADRKAGHAVGPRQGRHSLVPLPFQFRDELLEVFPRAQGSKIGIFLHVHHVLVALAHRMAE